MNKSVQSGIEDLLDRQRQAWSSGSRPSIETLAAKADLTLLSEHFLDLIYNEILLREKQGEQPRIEDYLDRFPELAEELKLHFEVHGALQDQLLLNTQAMNVDATLEEETLPILGVLPELEQYQIIGELGRGGMGVVYKARHRKLHRLVALKMFLPGKFPSDLEKQRFYREAQAIARLKHEHIVQIFEIGEENSAPYLALELAEQGTLATKLQSSVLSATEAAQLCSQLARGVQHAHTHRIIHRDLKPANVLFATDGTPKITDFGLAKILENDLQTSRDMTRTGDAIGTPRYMAPEQASGQYDQIGPGTDIYALGTLLYECLTGRVPFVSPKLLETLEMIRSDEPTPPRKLQPSIPRNLETICLKCLHKQPEKRYASAEALSEDLERFLQARPILARPTPRIEKWGLWCRRNPVATTLIILALLFTGIAGIQFRLQAIAQRNRIELLRKQAEGLIQQGREALAAEDDRTAQARFFEALKIVQSEPGLRDYELAVSGWLDHGRRSAERSRWKSRMEPQQYEELRDEAFLLLFLPGPIPQDTLLTAIQSARAFTIANDRAWQYEREQLLLLEATYLIKRGQAEKALTRLDEDGVTSGILSQKRLECLTLLKRPGIEEEQRRLATFPPKKSAELFARGLAAYLEADFSLAQTSFEALSRLEPEHYLARAFLAGTCLANHEPREALLLLTACLAQKPTMNICHLLRCLAHLEAGELRLAQDDLAYGLESNRSEQLKPWIALLQVECNLAAGNIEQAKTVLTSLQEVYPDLAITALAGSKFAVNARDWVNAEREVLRVIKLAPEGYEGFLLMATAHEQQHEWAKALADLQEISRRSPRLAESMPILYRKAQAHYHLGNWWDGFLLQLRVVRQPAMTRADSLMRARIYLEWGNPSAAVKELTQSSP